MRILSIKITTSSKEEIVKKVAFAIKEKQKFVILTPNPEIIELSQKMPELKEALNIADINLPDGTGLKIACNLKTLINKISFSSLLRTTGYVQRTPVIHGIDFMLDLCHEAEIQGWNIGLLGGMNNVAEKTRLNLLKRFPKLKIKYIYGDFNYSICENPSTNKPTIPTPATHLDLLFVAMGSPKEQLWISQNKEVFPSTVFMEVGGSFDIISGALKRAPRLMQKMGLEWLFRLIQEPSRFKRQLKLFSFIWHVLTTKNSITN
jgi:N-acetylglucosaminyldiphosphoundecaprenol N-acetyl-beta-D-mannosaminyltransferase